MVNKNEAMQIIDKISNIVNNHFDFADDVANSLDKILDTSKTKNELIDNIKDFRNKVRESNKTKAQEYNKFIVREIKKL